MTGLALLCAATPGQAQSSDQSDRHSVDELSRQVANPIAHLISVPLQNNMDFGAGQKNSMQDTLNIQPVIPLELGNGWGVVTRVILPVMYHGSAYTGDEYRSGLGDTSLSLFFHGPLEQGKPMIGLGPIIRVPTATDDQLGNRRWGAGPTMIMVQQSPRWTLGLLASHVWSFGDSPGRPDFNATSVQPFVAHTFSGGFSLSATTETVYDWTTRQWTVPLNLQAAQIVKLGPLPVSLFFGPRVYLQRPKGGPDWGLRFGVQFLFPT
ncbi:transporter family protein [Pseudoroseomonas ludipueritiae]|uniref:hypothetical protein n=1 Tax=Pseudoroseomonas ludipueritiae TaxID=198093 RepID=UPI003631C577